MLEALTIKNIAIIDSAEIRFKKGLNILSGETGAGKSIIIEAISLLLGSRANAELIRSGCDEALVEGLFDTSDIPWIQPRLEELGFETSSELLIRRTIHRNGKHRIHVNGQLATLSILHTLCEGLIDLCGQHEHQSLLKPSTQIELLDRYGSLTAKTAEFSRQFQTWRALIQERDRLQNSENERLQRADFLKFQIAELRGAELSPDEDTALQSEKVLLQSAETRVQMAEAASKLLEGSESADSLNALRAALARLKTLGALDERVAVLREGLERGIAEVEEVAIGLHRYLSNVDLDPERLQAVQERLSLIADLRRKYGSSVLEMLATLEKLETEYAGIDQVGTRLEAMESEIQQSLGQLTKLGRSLSTARKKAAEIFDASVTGELKDLKMGEAQFGIELTAQEDASDWNATGADTVQFVVQTNRGEPARPLGKIASGGELSRLMLAVRRVISDKGGIGVYLFDEIDAGIGGQTAFQVGKKLKSVAAFNQVICITHLPQVASFADHHLVVRKNTVGKRTQTEVVELSLNQRKEEIARMLGGPELTKRSLENATELMELSAPATKAQDAKATRKNPESPVRQTK